MKYIRKSMYLFLIVILFNLVPATAFGSSIKKAEDKSFTLEKFDCVVFYPNDWSLGKLGDNIDERCMYNTKKNEITVTCGSLNDNLNNPGTSSFICRIRNDMDNITSEENKLNLTDGSSLYIIYGELFDKNWEINIVKILDSNYCCINYQGTKTIMNQLKSTLIDIGMKINMNDYDTAIKVNKDLIDYQGFIVKKSSNYISLDKINWLTLFEMMKREDIMKEIENSEAIDYYYDDPGAHYIENLSNKATKLKLSKYVNIEDFYWVDYDTFATTNKLVDIDDNRIAVYEITYDKVKKVVNKIVRLQ